MSEKQDLLGKDIFDTYIDLGIKARLTYCTWNQGGLECTGLTIVL